MPKLSIRYLTIAVLFVVALLAACSRQNVEEKGLAMATEKIDLAKGVGEAMERKGEAAGEAVLTGMGKVFNGAAEGIAKSGREIALEPSMRTAGLSVSTVQETPADAEAPKNALSAYVIATGAARGQLRAHAYDASGKEIGRASVYLSRQADEARYMLVPFDEQVHLEHIKKITFQFKSEEKMASK